MGLVKAEYVAAGLNVDDVAFVSTIQQHTAVEDAVEAKVFARIFT